MPQTQTGSAPTLRRSSAPPRLAFAIGAPLLFLFGGAGTWQWPGAWAYMAVLIGGMVSAVVVFRKHPDLAHERAAHWRDGTPFDRVLLLVVGVLGPSAVQIVSGLDHRLFWSPPLPFALTIAGACAFAAGTAVTAWAMSVNRFFSCVVRIQVDRGHTVVTEGPYALVRHPGYAAMIVATIGCPLLLGSLWALVPSTIVVAAFLARTVNEERLLRAELPGYAVYAQRVRYRLLPGVW